MISTYYFLKIYKKLQKSKENSSNLVKKRQKIKKKSKIQHNKNIQRKIHKNVITLMPFLGGRYKIRPLNYLLRTSKKSKKNEKKKIKTKAQNIPKKSKIQKKNKISLISIFTLILFFIFKTYFQKKKICFLQNTFFKIVFFKVFVFWKF